jgi:hypothetical protein
MTENAHYIYDVAEPAEMPADNAAKSRQGCQNFAVPHSNFVPWMETQLSLSIHP